MPRDAVHHVHPISHIFRIPTVQIVALFEVLVSVSCVDACRTQPRLDSRPVEVRRRVYVSVQLRPHVPRRTPHAHALVPHIVCERTEMPHL